MSISYNQIMLNIRQGRYKYIADGSSRRVFDLKNGYVIKIAKNKAGIEQNKTEYRISDRDYSGMFAEVVYSSNDYKLIIMRKAAKVRNISEVWTYFNTRNKIEFLNLYEIQRIKNDYNLLLGDLNKKSSWGRINGRYVIIDYGFTKKVRDKYY